MPERRAAVIGAGLAGLACAARLAHAGYSVDLYEQAEQVGGKAGTLSLGGFRFDTGPSLLTLVPVFDRLFAETGERREEFVRFLPLAPICHYFYPDGTVLYSYSDRRRFSAEIEAKTADRARTLDRYLNYARRIYELAADLFLCHSLHDASTYLRADALRPLAGLGRLDAFRTMDAANRSFFSDPKMVQLFDRYATYNGSDPYRVPATLNIIPHVEYGLGGYAVEGGIHLAARVQRIMVQGRQVRGIRVGGRELQYEAVVSNVDALRSHRELIGVDTPAARRYEHLEPSSSGIVFFWGLRRRYRELGVNNVFFSSDYRRETEVTRERVIEKLERALGKQVAAAIDVERCLAPPDIEFATGSSHGSLYGISSNAPLAAFLRHPNRVPGIRGLYFCGGSVHPGGGMPLAVLSGKIAAELVRKDLPPGKGR